MLCSFGRGLDRIYISRSFWDIVVLTAGNEEQKKVFQEQIDVKIKRKEVPTSVRYAVHTSRPRSQADFFLIKRNTLNVFDL